MDFVLSSFTALAWTLATAGLFIGNAVAGPAPETWTITLKGPDKAPLAPDTSWVLVVFDAVKCDKAETKADSISKGGSATVKLLAREGGGSATKGQLGAHLRWEVSGKAPPDGKTKYWTGDPTITRNGATPSVVVDLSTGYGAAQNIGKSAGCDKDLTAKPTPTPTPTPKR